MGIYLMCIENHLQTTYNAEKNSLKFGKISLVFALCVGNNSYICDKRLYEIIQTLAFLLIKYSYL